MPHRSGRHFLQIPGPTNLPDRVLRAIDRPTIDHRGPEFAELTKAVMAGLQEVFRTKGHVVIYPASGSGAWEAALVNTLSPGDDVLAFDQGFFAVNWSMVASGAGRRCSNSTRPASFLTPRPPTSCSDCARPWRCFRIGQIGDFNDLMLAGTLCGVEMGLLD